MAGTVQGDIAREKQAQLAKTLDAAQEQQARLIQTDADHNAVLESAES
jgi:hypothetical protein